MIKKAVLTLTTLLISSTALAASPAKPVDIEQTRNFIVTPSVAYRYDVFKWSVPHPQYNHKLSELVWKNHIFQPSIKIEIEPKPDQFTFLGQTKYGYILKHPSKKLDYDWKSISSKPTSKSLSSVRGKIVDLSGAVGYSLGLFKENFITFYVGYDYSDYRNKNYGYRQLIFKRETLPLNQLISKYFFKTNSPWVGLSINTSITDRFQVIPTIKYYSFKYVGRGYWLLRDDLKQDPSFKNTAKGKGLGIDLDFIYKYSDNLDFKINLETKKFKMKSGTDQLFYNAKAMGGERVFIGKLSNLSLLSSSISIGLKYKM